MVTVVCEKAVREDPHYVGHMRKMAVQSEFCQIAFHPTFKQMDALWELHIFTILTKNLQCKSCTKKRNWLLRPIKLVKSKKSFWIPLNQSPNTCRPSCAIFTVPQWGPFRVPMGTFLGIWVPFFSILD